MKIPRDFREIVDLATAHGCHVEDGRKHLKLRFPDGRMAVMPRSPSDWRGVRNFTARVKRMLEE